MTDENELIELNITPVRELFYRNDFGIYAADVEQSDKIKLNKYGNITIRGITDQLVLNRDYHVKLIPEEDKKYGLTYTINTLYEDVSSEKGQKAFLESVLTQPQVKHLYEAYLNQDIVQLIINDKIDFNKVNGVGKITLKRIKDHVLDNIESQKAFEYLKQYGLTNQLITRLVHKFGSANLLISKMKKNPYVITKLDGIGFLKADPIALQMGIESDSPERIHNAVRYVLSQESGNGHIYTLVDKLITQTNELTGIDYGKINGELLNINSIVIKQNRVALEKYYLDEKYIAKRLLEVLYNSNSLIIDIDKFIKLKEHELKTKLTDQQKNILKVITQKNIAVLAGFGGSGKSFTTQFVIKLLNELNIKYLLVSPTAKAAKVLSEYTGEESVTIHRAIGIKGDFQKQSDDHLIGEEFLLMDESSMSDIPLCARMLRDCINPNVRILFVGDPGQLPSVNVGQLLMDLIDSHQIPVVTLDKIFRQAEGGILDKATKIRQGEVFVSHDFWGIKKFGKDMILACIPQEKILSGYKYYYKELLKIYKPDEISICVPSKKGQFGTVAINQEIQDIVNPPSNDKSEYICNYTGIKFRTGDLVMNVVNNYKDFYTIDEEHIDVINGDQGKIIEIDTNHKQMVVELNGIPIIYSFSDAKQLILAYALTTHKLQGSSNKAIIVIADKSNVFMLNRYLLYTALTRAREQLIMLTQAETLNRAIKRKTNLKRRTFLKDLLIEESKKWDK